MDRRLYVIDFETTDVDTKKAKPVEVSLRSTAEYAHKGYLTLINPGCDIPPETSAIHHICDDDVVDAPSWDEVKPLLADLVSLSDNIALPVLIAHNAKYDREILGEFVPVQWICTYKCALRVWPDAPAHKNEVLRYWLQLPGRGRTAEQSSHNAGHDTYVTKQIFLKLLEHATVEEMIRWTEEPAQIPRIPFGKHRGMKWSEIPGGYLEWLLRQSDMDADILACAKAEKSSRERFRR